MRRTVAASSSSAIACRPDRKSTRLNSSHDQISYAVFCLKKKKKNTHAPCSLEELSESRMRHLIASFHLVNDHDGVLVSPAWLTSYAITCVPELGTRLLSY